MFFTYYEYLQLFYFYLFKLLFFLGINVHTEDLLRDSSQIQLVKRAGLVLFCWGDDNNDMETNKHLKQLGIHAVIYDKIDQYSSKEVNFLFLSTIK